MVGEGGSAETREEPRLLPALTEEHEHTRPAGDRAISNQVGECQDFGGYPVQPMGGGTWFGVTLSGLLGQAKP